MLTALQNWTTTKDSLNKSSAVIGVSGNVGHVIDLELQFQYEILQWDQTILQPCHGLPDLIPTTKLLLTGLTTTIYKLRDEHALLLQKLKDFPVATSVDNPELIKMIQDQMVALEGSYKLYANSFFDGYQLLVKLQAKLPPTSQSLELFMYKPFEMVMVYKKLVQSSSELVVSPDSTPALEGLASLIASSKPEVSDYEQLYQLQKQLDNPQFDLTRTYRKILLRSNFDLMGMKWLTIKPRIPTSTPPRIHCILLSDTFLVLDINKPSHQVLFKWDHLQDLSIIQLKPRAGDPFGTSMLLVIRKVVAFKVHAANPETKTDWVQWVDQTKHYPSQLSYPTIGESMRDFMTPIDMSKSNSTPSKTPLDSEPLIRQSSEGSNPTKFDFKPTKDVNKLVLNHLPAVVEILPEPRKESTSVTPSAVTGRSSSTTIGSELANTAGVCRFLSKPCHLLSHKPDSFDWIPYKASLDIRRYPSQPSYLLGWDHFNRPIMKIPIVMNQTKLLVINHTDLELTYRNHQYQLTMSDAKESLEFQSSFKAEQNQVAPSIVEEELETFTNDHFYTPSQPSHLTQSSSLYASSRSYPSDSTCLISVTCKLFTLRDQSWAKIGSSQLELYKETSHHSTSPPSPRTLSQTNPPTPSPKQNNYHLLVKSNSTPSASTRIHFTPTTFRCEKLSPLKFLIVHLDSHKKTTTIMIQVKSKLVAKELSQFLI